LLSYFDFVMALTDKEIDNILVNSDFEFSNLDSDSEIDDSDVDPDFINVSGNYNIIIINNLYLLDTIINYT